MRATTNQSGAQRVRGCAGPEPGGRWAERGAAGPLGLLAVFVATAMVLTVVLLFVTGVAQQGILPRVRARALRALNPVPADSTAAQTQGQESATQEASTSAEPQSAEAAPEAGGAPAGGAAPALSQAQLDSLRTLNDQIRVGRESLEDRISTVHQEAVRLEQERSAADEEADRRLKTLAKVYSSMKPEAAARVMASLDDTTFARVLSQLDRRQAAKVLALLDPERVARLTQEAATSVAARDGH
jgi:flagellar motility protein MotE (MotC chaperone)